MRHKESFFSQSLKNIKTVGSVTRSSPYLCKEIIKQIEWTDHQVILELGAGDGVITKFILKKMSDTSTLIALEINPVFCQDLLAIKDPRLIVIQKDAMHLDEILKELNIDQLDHVISAIPFVILPEEDALYIIRAGFNHLKEGGRFLQVHYSLLAKKMYEKVFGVVQIKFIAFNIPPAFLLMMQKIKKSE